MTYSYPCQHLEQNTCESSTMDWSAFQDANRQKPRHVYMTLNQAAGAANPLMISLLPLGARPSVSPKATEVN